MMPNINFAGINFDPKTIEGYSKLGIDKGFKAPFTTSLLSPGPAPKSALERYAESRQATIDKFFSSPAGKSEIGAAMIAGNIGVDPLQLQAQAELQKQMADYRFGQEKEAFKLSEEAAIRKQGRQFTMDQMGRLLESIPRAFGPIPFERTQEVTANIANLVSPRNLNPQAQLQQAQYSMPARQYFS